MKPSETQDGQAWVGNFAPADRATAELLVDSLEIHDHVEIMGALAQQLRQAILPGSGMAPAVLVPVRSMEDVDALGVTSIEHTAYRTFNPGAGFPALPGSEADIGAMSRGLVEAQPDLFLSPETSLDEMKSLRARTICLVVDYCGSGNQAARFAQTFRSNPTIASWISYKLLRLRVVTYAANLEASRRFKTDPHVDFESRIVAKSAMSADWSEEQREQVMQLCVDYADPADPNMALGYKDSFGLYLTNMRVPNNLPQILIRSAGPFPGLFAGRRVSPLFVTELRSYRPAPSLVRTLRNLGNDRLASRLEDATRPVQALRGLAALQLLDFGMSEDQVWAMLGLDAQGVTELTTTLIALECITIDNKLTKRGRAELQRATFLGVANARVPHSPSPPVSYEPTQLR